jgi:nucleotide-binding universal stress UspA family protein
MPHIERILCPIDFSEFSEKAYDYAQSLARQYKATLFLLHVIDSLTPLYPYQAYPDAYNEMCRNLRAGAERQLQEFAEKHARHGILPQCKVGDGVATDLILDFADAQAANLIVMGTHGLRGIDHLTLGSVTQKVLRKARCPVLAVRKPAHDLVIPGEEPDLIHLHRILCCTDFSDCSEKAFQDAVSLAAEYKAELTLLHVLESIADSADIENEMAKVMQSLEKRTSPETRNNCTTKAVARIGKAYQQIIELALESQTDLIVMGVRGRHALDLRVFGSTTYRVVQLGPCPVLVTHM